VHSGGASPETAHLFLLCSPTDTHQACTALRPFLLLLVGRLAETREAGAAATLDSAAEALTADEQAAEALSHLLVLAPHIAPLALRVLRASAPPLGRFAGQSSAVAASEPPAHWPRTRSLTRAALRLAEAAAADAPLAAVCGAAVAAPAALRLLRHPCLHVRFAAARLTARGLALSATAAAAVRRTVLSVEEEVEASLVLDQQTSAYAVERASWFTVRALLRAAVGSGDVFCQAAAASPLRPVCRETPRAKRGLKISGLARHRPRI